MKKELLATILFTVFWTSFAFAADPLRAACVVLFEAVLTVLVGQVLLARANLAVFAKCRADFLFLLFRHTEICQDRWNNVCPAKCRKLAHFRPIQMAKIPPDSPRRAAG